MALQPMLQSVTLMTSVMRVGKRKLTDILMPMKMGLMMAMKMAY